MAGQKLGVEKSAAGARRHRTHLVLLPRFEERVDGLNRAGGVLERGFPEVAEVQDGAPDVHGFCDVNDGFSGLRAGGRLWYGKHVREYGGYVRNEELVNVVFDTL